MKDYGYKELSIKEKYKIKELEKIGNRLVGLIYYLGVELVYKQGKSKTTVQRLYDNFKTYLKKIEEYNSDLKIIGSTRNSYSKTDHDGTFMHMKEDHMRSAQLKPGYNVQIGVSNEYIMVIDAYQNGSGQKAFKPILEKYNIMYDKYSKYPVTDAGYGSFDNYSYCIEKGMELYQKFGMWSKEREPKFKNLIYKQENLKQDKAGNYICPNNKKLIKQYDFISKYIEAPHTKTICECFYCDRCRKKKHCTTGKGNRTITVLNGLKKMKDKVNENLDSELGIELRVQRSIQVEGAFGIIKEDMKFRRFTRTKLSGIKLELNLIAIGFNLKNF